MGVYCEDITNDSRQEPRDPCCQTKGSQFIIDAISKQVLLNMFIEPDEQKRLEFAEDAGSEWTHSKRIRPEVEPEFEAAAKLKTQMWHSYRGCCTVPSGGSHKIHDHSTSALHRQSRHCRQLGGPAQKQLNRRTFINIHRI